MGESLDIPAADTAIFLDQNYSSLKMAQAVERIDRATDTPRAKNIIRLIAPTTVDELIMQALQGKWSQQELVFHFLESYG
jgi:predicted helicase